MLANLFPRHPSIAADLPRTTLPAFDERNGDFARLTGERIAIYWPHGFGDWVHFGAIARLLSPENAYAIFRIGDDFSALFTGASPVAALPSGIRAIGDGTELGARHLGLNWKCLHGKRETVALPGTLPAAFAAFAPTALLYTDYPEPEGMLAFPYHTKARALARFLVKEARLAAFDLGQPLPQSPSFVASPDLQRRFDEVLGRYVAPNERVLLLATSGHTEPGKAWPAEDARRFVELLRARDPRLRVVVFGEAGDSGDGWMESGGTLTFRAIAAELEAPFAEILLALMARSHAFVGVPAGPLHAVAARGGIPMVGLWFAHYPTWYDEPNPLALHLVGARPIARGFHRRPGSTTLPPSLAHRIEHLGTERIAPEEVLDALARLGAISAS
ncbi:MAG: hypothetical protein HKL91_04990 [Candidatus Eremiobacteraeota bacterium]|uniref:Uncharacterized protein n=1 Tax=mine drainage metagenome TaxID=410659 RepID=E6PID9_9ZZZZ|nr:hypothetical protein [Candidatus Eremiobacteraeota bacterium]